MTNQYVFMVYTLVLTGMVLLFLSTLLQSKRSRPSYAYLGSILSIIGWLAFEIIFFTSKNHFLQRYAYDLKMIFIATIPVFILLVIIEFYHLGHRLSPIARKLLFLIPAITALLCITSPLHTLMLKELTIHAYEPLLLAGRIRGPWYLVHLIYTHCLAAYIFFTVLREHIKLPKGYRTYSAIIMFVMPIYFAGVVIEAFNWDNTEFDTLLLCAALIQLIFYLTTISYSSGSFLLIQRKNVFAVWTEPVFIIDRDDRIVDTTASAQQFITMADMTEGQPTFEALLNRLVEKSLIVRKPIQADGSCDIYIEHSFAQTTYNLRIIPARRSIMRYAILQNVTQERLMTQRLKDAAGADELTGLANRYRFNDELHQLDAPEFLPLTVILGDVNRLKHINDTYGHDEGDRLLQVVSTVLKNCCPAAGVAARFGGDEFALLLPNCDGGEAKIVVHAVHSALEKTETLKEKPTISLGYAVKCEPSQNLNKLIAEADNSMYEAKHSK